MPRIARRKFNTTFFHIMVQGINKEYIFNTNKLKDKYLTLFQSNFDKCNIDLLAYCIMSNHTHMLIHSNCNEDMSNAMKRINTSYAMYYNKCNNRVGVVYRNRYKSQPIVDRQHLLNCVAYIHNNPVKAGIVKRPEQYIYSSYSKFIEGSISEKVLKLLFDNTDDYMEVFDFMHKNNNYSEFEFIDDKEDLDYMLKIDELVRNKKTEMVFSEKKLRETVRKLIVDEKIPISKICEALDISRYKISKILKE